MDNREAMIDAYKLDTGNDFNENITCDDIGVKLYALGFMRSWQAATAHNTDAVIDDCMNEVQKSTDEFVTSVHLGFNFKFNEMVEDMMNRLRALKTSSAIKIRSLKINKEG